MNLGILILALASFAPLAGAKDKKDDSALLPPITEAQRTHVRELERDYAQYTIAVVQGEMAKLKQEQVRMEYSTLLLQMKGTCKKDLEVWNEPALKCDPAPQKK